MTRPLTTSLVDATQRAIQVHFSGSNWWEEDNFCQIIFFLAPSSTGSHSVFYLLDCFKNEGNTFEHRHHNKRQSATAPSAEPIGSSTTPSHTPQSHLLVLVSFHRRDDITCKKDDSQHKHVSFLPSSWLHSNAIFGVPALTKLACKHALCTCILRHLWGKFALLSLFQFPLKFAISLKFPTVVIYYDTMGMPHQHSNATPVGNPFFSELLFLYIFTLFYIHSTCSI